MVGDTRTKAGVRLEERFHSGGVARENHGEIVALVFHHLQQDLDGLLAVILLVLRTIEIVGLVDEQHAAHGALQHVLRLRRGVADVLADEVIARHRDEVAFANITEAMEDARHSHRHRRLAGAGVAGKSHVKRRRCRGEARAFSRSGDEQERSDLANPPLHRREPDELGVELLQQRTDVRLGMQRVEVDHARSSV